MNTREEPDERIQRYLEWYYKRLVGRPEDEVLRELGERELGEFGSPRALYARLANDGFPVCKVCGETPRQHDHCEKPGRRRRRAKPGTDSLVRLPPAGAARELFLVTLEEMKFDLNSLNIEEDWRSGDKRFITAYVDRDVYEEVRRAEYSEEEWKELCERHGMDPTVTASLHVHTTEVGPGGLNRAPTERLVALIATYVLSTYLFRSQPLESLLETLHPEPAEADKEKLREKIKQLKKAVRDVAVVVRGGKVERGTSIVEVSRRDHFLSWEIHELDPRRRCSDEELLKLLKTRWGESLNDVTARDIRWLRSLRLPRPE